MSNKKLPKVLCVDDQEGFLEDYTRKFTGQVRLFVASSLEEAWNIFKNHNGTFHVIMLDACVPGDEPNVREFIRKIQGAAYAGLLHGVHGNPEFRDRLEAWGCASVSGKDAGPAAVLVALSVPATPVRLSSLRTTRFADGGWRVISLPEPYFAGSIGVWKRPSHKSYLPIARFAVLPMPPSLSAWLANGG